MWWHLSQGLDSKLALDQLQKLVLKHSLLSYLLSQIKFVIKASVYKENSASADGGPRSQVCAR
jgi:hypothetical protein